MLLEPASDAEIAAHEAGHAVMAHVLGLSVVKIELHADAHTAARTVIRGSDIDGSQALDRRLIAFAGVTGESIITGRIKWNRASADLHLIVGYPLPPDAAPVTETQAALGRHLVAFHAVRNEIESAILDERRAEVPGELVHQIARAAGSQPGVERQSHR